MDKHIQEFGYQHFCEHFRFRDVDKLLGENVLASHDLAMDYMVKRNEEAEGVVV
jgi:hypothetical protein